MRAGPEETSCGLPEILIGSALALSALASVGPALVGAELADAAGEAHPAARPGLGVDIGARLIADKLSAKWGQPVVVENRPGGDGIVAISAFTGAKDDHIAADVADLVVHRASVTCTTSCPTIRASSRPIARMSNTIVGVAVPASSDDQDRQATWSTTRTRQSRQAELGDHHRHVRFRVRRLPEEGGHRDRQGALSRHGAGGDRSRRGPHPAHDVGRSRSCGRTCRPARSACSR